MKFNYDSLINIYLQDMMLQALTNSKPSVSQEDLTKIDDFTREFGPYIAESSSE